MICRFVANFNGAYLREDPIFFLVDLRRVDDVNDFERFPAQMEEERHQKMITY
jgi:hypothetical protein